MFSKEDGVYLLVGVLYACRMYMRLCEFVHKIHMNVSTKMILKSATVKKEQIIVTFQVSLDSSSGDKTNDDEFSVAHDLLFL